MKRTLLCLAVTLSLGACSSITKGTGEIEPIRDQKLSSSFVGDGVKIETNCSWYNINKSNCQIIAIEATGTTATNGNSANNLRTGLIRAGDIARANVSHFIKEDISSTRVTNTLAKNIEKANDRMKSRTLTGDTVEMSDKEAEKDTNFAIRENSNDTAHQLTQTVRVNSQNILRGFKVIKQEKVGDQEVAVTIRWDLDSGRAANELRRRMGN
jgi:hypothetical protein